MPSPLRCLLTALAASALAIIASCADDGEPSPPGTSGPGSGAGVPYDGGTDDADAAAGGASPDAGDAGLTPVLVGITPSPRSDHDGPPTAGDVLEAQLATFAVGARSVAVTRPLRDLDDPAYAALADLGAFYAAHDKQVLFNLALVDRAADARPPLLEPLPWNDPDVVLAVHDAIDALLGSFGAELRYLTFGRDVDAYLLEHPDRRGAFEQIATDACAYAAAHPGAPPGLRVGVGFSFEGAAAPDPSFPELLAAGDVAVLSYVPGLAAGRAAPTSAVADALDAMAAIADGRPVVLQAVGYPSAAEAAGSDEKQRLFFQNFFDALGPRRGAFELVNVVELHDPAPAACDAYAAAQGEPPGGAFARFACSLGLFDQGAADKPAWLEVASGVAAFASP